MKIINVFLDTGRLIVIILFFYGEIFGIAHSIIKHSFDDVTTSIMVPPWAWWRSIEMWTNNDKPKIDWDTKISKDLKDFILIIAESDKLIIDESDKPLTDKSKLDSEIKKISLRVKEYPTDKKRILINSTKSYLDYINSYNTDLTKSIEDFFDKGVYK